MKHTLKPCKLDDLLLDPNNYRFLDKLGYRVVDERRYHEDSVQRKAHELLLGPRGEDVAPLKDSIISNGYVPLEALVVRPYGNKKGLFVTIEGNRRVAAMRWIVQDQLAGVQIGATIIKSFKSLQVVVIDPTLKQNRDAVQVLMGIRHVSGIKQWGAYQQAKLIVDLMDELGVSLQETHERLAMSATEVNRRYRAFNALKQMENDEEFESRATPDLYRMFHEAVSTPAIRDWLGWDESKGEFTNDETRREFYSMIVRHQDEDGNVQQPKLNTYADVRELKRILPNPDAKSILLDSSKTLSDALAVVVAEGGRGWLEKAESAIVALQNLSVRDVKGLSVEGIETLRKLRDLVNEQLEGYKQLTRQRKGK